MYCMLFLFMFINWQISQYIVIFYIDLFKEREMSLSIVVVHESNKK